MSTDESRWSPAAVFADESVDDAFTDFLGLSSGAEWEDVDWGKDSEYDALPEPRNCVASLSKFDRENFF